MPLKMPGSVSARLSVWFSLASAARNGLAADEVERRPPLRSRLGQDERPRREVEGGEADLAPQLRARRLPVEPAGDHEVQDEKEIALQPDDDALAEATEPRDAPARGRRERRIDGAEQEGIREAHALQTRAGDARFERFDVDDDVGQLGHLGILV